jgi:hypothetical protein
VTFALLFLLVLVDSLDLGRASIWRHLPAEAPRSEVDRQFGPIEQQPLTGQKGAVSARTETLGRPPWKS